jgi:hypothetical protein
METPSTYLGECNDELLTELMKKVDMETFDNYLSVFNFFNLYGEELDGFYTKGCGGDIDVLEAYLKSTFVKINNSKRVAVVARNWKNETDWKGWVTTIGGPYQEDRTSVLEALVLRSTNLRGISLYIEHLTLQNKCLTAVNEMVCDKVGVLVYIILSWPDVLVFDGILALSYINDTDDGGVDKSVECV